MLEAKNLTKIFKSEAGEVVAIHDISFMVPQGQFMTISGKSGSGKSTLLYQLGLLDFPTAGQVYIDGEEFTTESEGKRTSVRLNDLGYIFQDYAILPSLTALENTVLPLLMQGYPLAKAQAKAKIALGQMGLLDRMHNLPAALSGGQQQRVAIARAIAHEPKIIFADEPAANLDTETSAQVMQAFLDLNRAGQTIVMVTHEAEYAKLADRTIQMADGAIVSDIMHKK